MNRFGKLVNFDNTDGAGSPPPEETPKAETWTPEQQTEFDKRAAALKKAAKNEAKAEALAEFEAKQKAAHDEAEKKRLAEEGQYKDLAEKADTAKSAAEKRAEEAEQKARAFELQLAFDRAVRAMGIEFANELAAEDAFTHLDLSLVGEDESGMKKAIEQLQKDRPHYFGEPQPAGNTDAGLRGKKQNSQQSDEERKQEIRQRFNIRRPR
jgi:hypothetical protein